MTTEPELPAIVTAAEDAVMSDVRVIFDLDKSMDYPGDAKRRIGCDLYNVIDWSGQHRGQMALTTDEAAALECIIRPAIARRSGTLPSGVKALDRFEPFANEDDGEFVGMKPYADGDWVLYSGALSCLSSSPPVEPVAWPLDCGECGKPVQAHDETIIGDVPMHKICADIWCNRNADEIAGLVPWRSVIDDQPVVVGALARFLDEEMGDYVYTVFDGGPLKFSLAAPYTDWLPLDLFKKPLYAAPQPAAPQPAVPGVSEAMVERACKFMARTHAFGQGRTFEQTLDFEAQSWRRFEREVRDILTAALSEQSPSTNGV